MGENSPFCECLKEELEAVEAILMDGIEVDEREQTVTVQLHPLTASEEDKKYVAAALRLKFTLVYPQEAPLISVRPL